MAKVRRSTRPGFQQIPEEQISKLKRIQIGTAMIDDQTVVVLILTDSDHTRSYAMPTAMIPLLIEDFRRVEGIVRAPMSTTVQ